MSERDKPKGTERWKRVFTASGETGDAYSAVATSVWATRRLVGGTSDVSDVAIARALQRRGNPAGATDIAAVRALLKTFETEPGDHSGGQGS